MVTVRALAMHLLDLPAELLLAIASQLAEDDELAAELACRRLRQAVAGTERRAAGARLSTGVGSVFGSVGKLEWAVASCGLPLYGGLLLRAGRAGQLEQLIWLRAYGCRWVPLWGSGLDLCSEAAANGHLHVLQWARADGYPWDHATCTSAARGGHLAVLQWLHANGCPWTKDACTDAAGVGTWLCCSGYVPMAARGMRALAERSFRSMFFPEAQPTSDPSGAQRTVCNLWARVPGGTLSLSQQCFQLMSRCTARSRGSSSHLVAGNARQVHRNGMPDDFV
jgi:hypothetical protein